MKNLHIALGAVVLAAAPALPLGARAAAARSTRHTARQARPHLYRVAIGVNTSLPVLTVNKFVPDRLIIHVGDSVQWTNAVPNEPQTVTFGPVENTPSLITLADLSEIDPRVTRPQGRRVVGDVSLTVYSSGVLMGGVRGLSASYTFTFRTVGSYLYRSLFHPSSVSEIDVVAANKPASPDPIDRGSSVVSALVSAATVLRDEASLERRGGSGGSNGVPEIEVGVGNNNVSINKFTPTGLTVKVGTQVTWMLRETSGDPHALVFSPNNTELQGHEPLYTGLAADGGLKINSVYTKATLASGTSVTAASIPAGSTSGILYGSAVNYPSKAPSSYTLTFQAPGQYYYADPFYPDMLGQINVVQ